MLKYSVFLLLLSLQDSSAMNLKSQFQKQAAQVQAKRSCSFNIDNYKNQRTEDFSSVALETTQWTDPQAFEYTNQSNANDWFWWKGQTQNEDGIKTWGKKIYWLHAMSTKAITNQSIYGSDLENNQNDIRQGDLGDCYYLAGISALAENMYRLEQTIETDTINDAGIFTMRVYIKGIPSMISVDDYIPFTWSRRSGFTPKLVLQGSDNSIWGMMLEKVWAKINGNYEKIIAGMGLEAFDLVGGCPSTYYRMDDTSTINSKGSNAYNIIDDANKKNYMMSTGCCREGSNYAAFDLFPGHAYTALGAVTVTQNDQQVQLILVRNPWGSQTYNGTWGPTDTTNWNDETTPQAPQYGQNSGNFYITADDYVTYFDDLSVGFFVDTYVNNFLEVIMCDVKDDQARTYTITFDEDAGETQLGVQFYNERIYPMGCNLNSQVKITIQSPSGTQLYNSWSWTTNQAGFQFLNVSSVEAGEYTMTVLVDWTTNVDVPDYTVRVYTDQIVHIKAATGEEGTYNYAMDNRNNTFATSAPEYTHATTCVDKMAVSEVSHDPNNTYLLQELEAFENNLPYGDYYRMWNSYYDYGQTTIPGSTGYDGWFMFEGKGRVTSYITLYFENNGGLYATTGEYTSCTGDSSYMECTCILIAGESCKIAISGFNYYELGYAWGY